MFYLWALPSAMPPSKEGLKESSCVRYVTKKPVCLDGWGQTARRGLGKQLKGSDQGLRGLGWQLQPCLM